MPKRTNAFQKLVLHMQNQLADGGTVIESALVRDQRTADEREVDILLKRRIAGIELTVGVECSAPGRRATVEWVDRMIGKHQSLATDALLLVSASGFTPAATNKAKALNVRTLALGEALELDWTTIVGKLGRLFLAGFVFKASGCRLTLANDRSGTEYPIGPGAELLYADGSKRGTVMDSARAALQDLTAAREIMNRMDRDGTGEGSFIVTFHQSTFAVDSGGSQHQIDKLLFTFTATRATNPIELKHGNWNGTPVAYGEGVSPFGKTFLAIEEPEPTKLRGTITFVDETTGKEISRPLPDVSDPGA